MRKEISSHFSLTGQSRVSGRIEIDELQGLMRLPVVENDDIKFYDTKLTVTGKATVKTGPLKIYSQVDIDFWQMAALFVDRPEDKSPQSTQLTLEGFTVDTIDAG